MRRSPGRPQRAGRLPQVVWPGGLDGAGRRVLSGRPLRWRHRRAGVVVVASDVDEAAGVAAVWLARRAGSPGAVEETCLFERVRGRWRYLGSGVGSGRELHLAGRPPASAAGPASMLTSMSGCASRSRADRHAQRGQPGLAYVGWVASERFRAATDVQHVQVGTRRVTVPEHGYVVVVWKAPPSDVPPQPPIAVVGPDGPG